ncbi:hypothetical protein PCASD_04899 [Puccinia coronata f. sp. avenae]|uniref:Uncharacterized protein n=2 Tax=Puccinia coronata f. sp. avenae TaxID=200324 RepID=A0A2N5VD77_9BASI|nr:hypothetical protein PCASD_04899 [Puccinia coronata f. sp. avenae]
MVAQVFKDNIALGHIVESKDCGSNIKDGGENNHPVTHCPHCQSPHLTSILHCLNKMVQTIATNQQLYGPQKLFVTGNGIKGVPQDLPVNSYNEAWWRGLPPYDRETLTTVEAINLAEVAKNLEIHCYGKNLTAGGNTGSGGSMQPGVKRRVNEISEEYKAPVASGSGNNAAPGETMHMD